jgi:hypothetical protein
MKIIIENIWEYFGKIGLSLDGRYNEEQTKKLIEDLLLSRGITAKITIDMKKLKSIDDFKSAEELVDEA